MVLGAILLFTTNFWVLDRQSIKSYLFIYSEKVDKPEYSR